MPFEITLFKSVINCKTTHADVQLMALFSGSEVLYFATKHLNLLLVTFNPLEHTNENGKGAHCPLKLMHLLQGKGVGWLCH